MAKSKIKKNSSPWTPEWLAGVVKECVGEANIVECHVPGRLKVKFGRNGGIGTSISRLAEEEARVGNGGARNFIITALKKGYPDDVKDFQTEAEQEIKEAAKRKQGDKAEATEKALNIAGSSHKERSETLKDL